MELKSVGRFKKCNKLAIYRYFVLLIKKLARRRISEYVNLFLGACDRVSV